MEAINPNIKDNWDTVKKLYDLGIRSTKIAIKYGSNKLAKNRTHIDTHDHPRCLNFGFPIFIHAII
jgi:hypothetical protein